MTKLWPNNVHVTKVVDMDFKFVLPSSYITFDIQTNFEVNQTQIGHSILKNTPKKTTLKMLGRVLAFPLGCALFSKFLGLNAVLVELDELSSGVPSFLKSDHGKLLRIAILCLGTWVSRGTCVMVS